MENNDICATDFYNETKDEELINIIRAGNTYCQDFLINKYKNIVSIKARTYFITGADKEDIMQEGMIGLFKAIRDFNMDKQTTFYSFADLCITRQIITAIKTASRKKHSPLNSYISLNNQTSDDNAQTFMDTAYLLVESLNPESIMIEKEDKEYIERKINESLSSFEAEVLHCYLMDKSYAEIANQTGKPLKSVDNALQRIKGKVERFVKTTGSLRYV